MRIVRDPTELEAVAGGALVPTMGALHEGHLALVRRARSLDGPLVVSIFVNPTQFGPGEDMEQYPRSLDADLVAAEHAGVDVVFAPDVETMYPHGADTGEPTLPAVATEPGLEDAHRPGHFAGVCLVVARLFDLVRPSTAVFGEKDYQQLLVVTEMIRAGADRWPGLAIVSHPTVRDPDGLALSSRNAYLSASDREQALGLSRALDAARIDGDPATAETRMHSILTDRGLRVDYAVVRDGRTLRTPTPGRPLRALIAARLGGVRLIDNAAIE